MSKPLMYFFDMDETLVEITDRKKDAESLYMTLDYQKNIPIMMELFKLIKVNYPTGLITTRHPDLDFAIQHKFDINLIITRDFCLEKKEMEDAKNNSKSDKEFMKNAVKSKIKKLNEYARHFDIVFFDDMAAKYWDNPDLAPNITVCLPLHDQKRMRHYT